MPSNEELASRAKQLLGDVEALTGSAKQHCDQYRALAKETYQNLQKYLAGKGVTTVDEWLKQCQKELSPDEVAVIDKALSGLKPAEGLAALTEPIEIARFIAGWFIVKGGMPLFQAAALSAKSFYLNYLAINRLPVVQAGALAEEATATSIASVSEELSAAAKFVEGDEAASLITTAQVEVSEVVAADAAIAAEAGAVAAAEAASAWNVVFLAIGGLILAGTYAYKKYKESKDAKELKDVIARVATARLYALVGDKSLLVQTDEHSLLRLLNEAFKKGDAEAQNFFKNEAMDTIQKSVAAITPKACYDLLQQQDKDHNAITEADPSFDDMQARHQRQIGISKVIVNRPIVSMPPFIPVPSGTGNEGEDTVQFGDFANVA